ncbi:MAG: hypothetical protein K5666_04215, partial [Bacilli bacterium]|nr:hypothetical protein [Bacilli bacterium]
KDYMEEINNIYYEEQKKSKDLPEQLQRNYEECITNIDSLDIPEDEKEKMKKEIEDFQKKLLFSHYSDSNNFEEEQEVQNKTR